MQRSFLFPVMLLVTPVLLGFSWVAIDWPTHFFNEKNVLLFSQVEFPKGGGGNKSRIEVTINSVTDKQLAAHSTAELVKYNRNGALYGRYPLQFAYDSVNFYAHAANYAFIVMNHVNSTGDYAGDSLWYPLSMKIGDTLTGAWASNTQHFRYYDERVRVDYVNRVVTAADSLTTPAGTKLAYKIQMKCNRVENSSTDLNEKYIRKRTIAITEWFVPEIGVVKAEFNDSNGLTRVTLDGYK